MAIRRGRRIGRQQGRLPFRANQLFSSISCWYCDLKIYMLNELLYFFGRRHARFLKSWMIIGVAFAVMCFVGITMMLVWEASKTFSLHGISFGVKDTSLRWFLGTSSLGSDFNISVMDFVVIVFSTILSVTVHELGHAVAAASQGVPVEYIAIFWAVIFPGALVAFNNDLLQTLSNLASLRIYCAGIWHNAVEDSCMTPLLSPGISWFEISYSNPYSLECLQQRRNTSSVDSNPGYASHPCGVGTFVYVGDKLMMTNSMRLSAYQPRWTIFSWSMDMPTTLERILACTYNVSAALAALNCLPIFFLDGEYILETGLCYITCLRPRRRRMALRIFLIAGTMLSAIAFSRIVYSTVHPVNGG